MIRQTMPQYSTLIFYSSLSKRAIGNKNVQIAFTFCSIIMYIMVVYKVTIKCNFEVDKNQHLCKTVSQ